MTFRNPDAITRPTRALLVCIAENRFSRTASRRANIHSLESNGALLLEQWERAELPVVFAERTPAVERERSLSMSSKRAKSIATSKGEVIVGASFAADFSDPTRRPRPGDFVFQSESPSLLRQRRFNRLFEDLGGPLLILIGDELGDAVLETAIDGFLSGHPIIVVKDAASPSLSDIETATSSRARALPLLSCFARLMTTDELLGEWTSSRS